MLISPTTDIDINENNWFFVIAWHLDVIINVASVVIPIRWLLNLRSWCMPDLIIRIYTCAYSEQ